jgi:hypothetical protein
MDDPKVQMLNDWHYRAWDTLLCFASKHGGEFTDNFDVLAFVLRKPVGKVRDTMQVLLSAGLMDKTQDGYKPHNWDEFQYVSDNSTQRSKDHRERKRNANCNDDATLQQRREIENATPPDTEQIQSRAETKNILSADAAKPARKRASKPVVVPEGFAEFWQAYPDSRAKSDALKAYCQAIDRGSSAADLLAGAKRYAIECKGKERQYIKLAGGWIRGERWTDETTPKPALTLVPRLTAEEEAQERENLKRLGVI